ncbi:MAG: DinB family protein [Phycisphaeraceae bacterium]|nr:DinB family protein [Phycisphaeraceae bacterium]
MAGTPTASGSIEAVKLDQVMALSQPELVARFGAGVEAFDRRVFELDDAGLDTAFLPSAGVGRWPCRVLLGHLADAELSFVQRLRRIVAEDGPVLEAWDENAFIDRAVMYGTPQTGSRFPIGAFVATVHTLRKWTHEWLAGLPPEAWARTGMHTVRGEMTFRTVLEYDVWHLEHHAWYLNRKVERLLGPGAVAPPP